MLQPGDRPRQTPGRRRQTRNPARPPGQKSYASENDVPASSNSSFQEYPPRRRRARHPAEVGPGHPRRRPPWPPPRPRPPSAAAPSPGPKTSSTSPGPAKPGRRTPPQTAGAKPVAYAGATFHASPAPSSLPIPSFFAKSMPDSPGRREPGNVNQEPSPPASDSDVPSPPPPSSAPRAAREESPLDIFFRADRAEKERARRASSANALGHAPGPFSPPLHARSPQENNSFPRGSGQQLGRRPPPPRDPLAAAGISATELDGTPGKPMGPAFATPYQERIKAARLAEKQAQLPLRAFQQQQQVQSDRSDDLKRFLFGGKQLPSPEADQTRPQQTRETAPASPPLDAAGGSGGDPARLRVMEDSLRQILKLDSLGLGSSPMANRS